MQTGLLISASFCGSGTGSSFSKKRIRIRLFTFVRIRILRHFEPPCLHYEHPMPVTHGSSTAPDPDLASRNNVFRIRQCSGTGMICCGSRSDFLKRFVFDSGSDSGCRKYLKQCSKKEKIVGNLAFSMSEAAYFPESCPLFFDYIPCWYGIQIRFRFR